MKIVVGIGSIDEYEAYKRAGADEFYCGYVPESWALKYGTLQALNRREVRYYNVQIGSESELEILYKMVERKGAPVAVTFNSLSYTGEQYPQIADIMERCRRAGFTSFIVADPALLVYLKEHAMKNIRLHISGELGEVNHYMVEEMRALGAKRIIFHRKNTLADMRRIIEKERSLHPEEPLEYEAFAMNEMCHYNGAYCNSLHCDELPHMCHIPYRLGRLDATAEPELPDGNCDRGACGQTGFIDPEEERCIPGMTGCGLCALYQMRAAGVTHLKVVSRGNYIDDTIEDIRALRQALAILEETASEEAYIALMKREIFGGKCSGNCYYFVQCG